MILSANGQNIYPEEIESKLNNMSCVLESLVVERDGKLVALVYPDYEQADEAGISYSDIQRVMDENKEVLNTLVAPYEQVTKIMLWPNEFEKTPKKSIKRFLYNRSTGHNAYTGTRQYRDNGTCDYYTQRTIRRQADAELLTHFIGLHRSGQPFPAAATDGVRTSGCAAGG